MFLVRSRAKTVFQFHPCRFSYVSNRHLTAAGVVPCGGPKTVPYIVNGAVYIFTFLSFEISVR